VSFEGPCYRRHYRFTLPDVKLWWPVDLGDPNLYRIKVSFVPDKGETVADHRESLFGVRTVEQAPLPEGPAPELYNWTFVINGEPHFIKGTNWCTLDPLMDFSRERYERFVSLAVDQHIQMFRPWGSGMPETDDFYDLCDRNGILVFQEWPTAWNSHETQPYDALEETVRLNTLRIRNHPSLAMYGGGNESSEPFGPAIDMMGRLAFELDGTRVFHRGEPWGGSIHNYNVYWSRQHFDYNLDLIAPFFGEFGVACSPPYESVQRYLPEEERDLWPPREDGAFAYHTPIFNTRQGVSRLTQYASFFVPKDCTLEEYTVGSQLSQAIGLRHPLERARTRWPDCAGALYYKMNDNFPAASWATADWYGAVKTGHYVVQDAFAPLHACLLFKTLRLAGAPASLPVYLLDDAGDLADLPWTVLVRAFDSSLAEMERAEFSGSGSIDSPARLGDFELGYGQTDSAPLLFVVEVTAGGAAVDRTFYVANFDYQKGCLFTLPRTSVSLSSGNSEVTLENTGKVPAVCVTVERPGHLDTFTAGDGCFWLDPGEKQTISVSETDGLVATAWNLDGRGASWVK
jgi:beta-mannosidase